MNYLVTGGAGFIGSHIVDRLVETGGSVRVLDDFSTGKKENLRRLKERIEVVEGDIRDYDLVRRASDGIDIVFHEAAISSVAKSVDDPVNVSDVNVMGTVNVLHAARDAGAKRVVYASSAAVYGSGGFGPRRETMPPSPQSPYAVSKLAGEHYCNVFTKLYGLHTVCLRYFNVYGERQDPSSEYSGVISRFVSALTEDKNVVIYGTGEQSRDFVYVGDVVDASMLAASAKCRPGIALNIGRSVSTTINRVLMELSSVLRKNAQTVYESARAGDIKESLADISLARKELSYKPDIDLHTGLRRTVAMQANSAMEGR